MLSRFKKHSDKNTFTNIFYLGFIQLINYCLPLIVIPYLIKTLGLSNFGKIIFVQSVASYFILIVDYGFNLTGVKDVLKETTFEDRNYKVHEIFFTKIVLLLISTIFFTCFIFFIPFFRNEWPIYFAGFLWVIGQTFFADWLFQALNKTKWLALINVVTKVLYAFLIFWLVSTKNDTTAAVLLYSFSFIFSSLLGILFIYSKLKFYYITPSWQGIKEQIISGWNVFLSRVMVSLYMTTNIFLLRFFAGELAVGIYGAADRIFKAVMGLSGPLTQGVYPSLTLSKKTDEPLVYKAKNRKWVLIFALFYLGVGIFMICSSGLIASILTKESLNEVKLNLIVLSIAIFFAPYGPLFTNFLILESKASILSRIVFIAVLLNFIIVIPLIMHYGSLGLSITMLIVVAFISISKGLYLKKKAIW
jgi:PST family polysaccharide transporter